MYSSAVFLAAFVALSAFVSATPPACLLAAVQEQPNPADLKAICGTLESAMAGNITEKCTGTAESAAISVYQATCLAQGVTVSVPTATGTGTKTGTAASATGTSKGNGVDAAGGSTTGSAATPSSTKNAASSMALQSSAAIGSLFLGLAYFL